MNINDIVYINIEPTLHNISLKNGISIVKGTIASINNDNIVVRIKSINDEAILLPVNKKEVYIDVKKAIEGITDKLNPTTEKPISDEN